MAAKGPDCRQECRDAAVGCYAWNEAGRRTDPFVRKHENIKKCRDDVVEAIFSKTWVQYMQNLGLECPKWASTDLIDFVSDRQHLLGGAN